MDFECDNGLRLTRYLDENLTLTQKVLKKSKYSLLHHIPSLGFRKKLRRIFRTGLWRVDEPMLFYVSQTTGQQRFWDHILTLYTNDDPSCLDMSPEEEQHMESLFDRETPILSLYGLDSLQESMFISCYIPEGCRDIFRWADSDCYEAIFKSSNTSVRKTIYPRRTFLKRYYPPWLTNCLPASSYSNVPFPVFFFKCQKKTAVLYRDLLLVYRRRAIVRGLEPTIGNIIDIFRNPPYEILIYFSKDGNIQYMPVYHDNDVTVPEIECYQKVFLWKLDMMTRRKTGGILGFIESCRSKKYEFGLECLNFATFEEFTKRFDCVSPESVVLDSIFTDSDIL
ncbi:hypothetical protein NCAS_0G01850 [Naumovozyma castellii]|uniref:Uncharacterized protein n=1 Tax=Naumovozyma castellii TaxID=27288 RepID=G0VI38_NAUCA|nr:hypothetical protein NCAS_0G01850 [Naumovozyma castellii CBS 4309]CCC71072.1 hypothetical protein NCAS_0G01850 [Naumovozyma castellii CBS 4309]